METKEPVTWIDKPWQKGYEIDFLRGLEDLYSDYNKYAASPFGEYNKNSIAKDLSEKKLERVYDNTGAIVSGRVLQRVKVKSAITLYQDIVIGWKTPGDVVITKLIGTSDGVKAMLDKHQTENVWIYTWAEDQTYDLNLYNAGFNYIGAKITTYGEIYAIWFRDSQIQDCSLYGDQNREHPIVDPIEKVTLKKVANVQFCTIQLIKEVLNEIDPTFAKSGLTSYINKSWSALSLRGYSTDPAMICKPSEMPDKWLEKNKGNYSDELVDTTLYEKFPMVREMLTNLLGPNVDYHRISFMSLTKNGTLNRHTDQIDKEHGWSLGQLARLHIPIQTNDKVRFIAWEPRGRKLDYNLKEGEVWTLDTRKPHMVIDESDHDRIHLVVDIMITPELKALLLR